ncbi:GTP binding nuclear protein RAN [Thecamonas trahens ATCC 50062]|uniref:GTP binding nuclear protein RAN n=1 Tax=Thecamonas trahens ATCC 50062 TaxID=461836 RepID=A0A0L0D189_THETB|nr:GTP binding nuclear protein RAN [Thecamonas trahens ATCC 50062]KNC45991.1 GTP binding nuclear protein RAN [Thecamonas trahens ATCC 50062]|eukprot:XP_013762971.1 GTP binding nuclear protein RAN [Thecamonas trahens ATCC 50062]
MTQGGDAVRVEALEATVYPIHVRTTAGSVVFNTWVTDGPQMDERMLANVEAAILVFAVDARDSYKNLPHWHRHAYNSAGNSMRLPMVVCGNKVDVVERVVKPKHITFHRKKNLQYCDVSATGGYNVERPLLYLIRTLSGQPDLDLAE